MSQLSQDQSSQTQAAYAPQFIPQHFIEVALKNNVLKFGEFTLKSGRISPYFFNAGLLSTGELLSVLANGYADALAKQLQSTETSDLVILGQHTRVFRLWRRPRKHCGTITKSMPIGATTAKKPKTTGKAVCWLEPISKANRFG